LILSGFIVGNVLFIFTSFILFFSWANKDMQSLYGIVDKDQTHFKTETHYFSIVIR